MLMQSFLKRFPVIRAVLKYFFPDENFTASMNRCGRILFTIFFNTACEGLQTIQINTGIPGLPAQLPVHQIAPAAITF